MQVGDLVAYNHNVPNLVGLDATGMVVRVFTVHPTIPANTTIEVMWSDGVMRQLAGDVKVINESR